MSAITSSHCICGSMAAAADFIENGAGEKQVHRHTKASLPPSVSTVQQYHWNVEKQRRIVY